MNEDFLHPDHLITGNEINELRFLLGLSQKEFADRIGVINRFVEKNSIHKN